MTFRWGIMATGNIAGTMAEALALVDDAELLAVGSRTTASARKFADRFGIARAYGSYDDLLADPDVDIVYIATPNRLHADNIMAALDAGKHVLCEKPLTPSAAQSRACCDRARTERPVLDGGPVHGLLPGGARGGVRLIADGAIGTPSHVERRLRRPPRPGSVPQPVRSGP